MLQLRSVSHSRCPPPTITPRTLPSPSRIRTSSGHPLKPNKRQQQERERPCRPREADDGLLDATLPVSIAGHACVGKYNRDNGGAGEEHGVEDEDAEAFEQEGGVVPEEREEAGVGLVMCRADAVGWTHENGTQIKQRTEATRSSTTTCSSVSWVSVLVLQSR